jgi:hypothetical protein
MFIVLKTKKGQITMKTIRNSLLGFALLFAFSVVGMTGIALAEVNFNINIGPPPRESVPPLRVVMMRQTGVYFVPGISYDLFFFNGYWWSPRGDKWYRSKESNGVWVNIPRHNVPEHLFSIPKNYRTIYEKERPINYGQWKKQIRHDEGHGRRD